MKHNIRRFICILTALLLLLSSALAYSRLEKGDSGSEVLAMQNALKALGYSIATDGKFGNDTQQVIKSFQSKYGLTVDGIAGNETLTLLYSLSSSSGNNQESSSSGNTGSSSNTGSSTSGSYTATVVTGGGALALRLSASTSAQSIGSIPNGAKLTILRREGSWCYTFYNGVGGYVPAQYLQTAPTPTPTPQQNSSSGMVSTNVSAIVVTTGGSLNMRRNPTSGNNIIDTIPNGTRINVTAKGNEWCAVSYNGKSGYVLTSFLSFAAAATKTPTPTPTPSPSPTPVQNLSPSGVYATVSTTGGSLNMRRNPTSGNNIIDTIPNGTKVLVTARGAEWCAVYYNNRTGYVMSSYLSFTAAATQAPTPTPTPTPAPATQAPSGGASGSMTATVYTGNGDLNMRRTASTGNNIIATIPDGAIITVIDRGNVWSAVSYRGLTGYVMSSYLRFPSATPLPTLAPTAAPTQLPSSAGTTTAYVNTSGGSLNLRAKAQSGATILTTIPNNTPVTITSRGSTWCGVVYNGYTGFVMTSFLYFPPTATVPTPTPTPAVTLPPTASGQLTACVTTSGGTLNLRDQPSTDGSVIYKIPNGAALTVTQRGASWCAVIYNGISGHVMTSFLTFMTVNTATATPAPTQSPDNSGSTGTVSSYAMVTTSGGTLNLRAEESTTAKILTTIANGETVMVHQIGTEWCAVSYAGTSGYVMSKFLTFVASPSTPGGSNPSEPSDPSQYSRTLKKGMIGADVDWVQSRLIELGYSLTATGVYDDQTIAAVKHFQSQNALSTDGLAGSQTFSLLRSSNARKASDPPLNYDTLRVDDQGEAVSSMQRALKELGYNVTVNGDFDAATHNAVVAFQQRNGLVISGIADSLTRQIIHSDNAKLYSTPVEQLAPNEGKIAGPTLDQMELLHWQNEIKPNVKTGQTFLIFDPNTNISWNLKFYALGRHADSQPATWRDTQLMNRSFGSTSWTIHPVYVLLPTGQWTMATMHNMPHLYGSINDNGFGGHLCVHFLRDMSEAQRNDPNYGVKNQNTLRNAWKALTGETITN